MSDRIPAGRVNGRARPRGYAAWRPQAKTRVLLEQIDEILEEYADYLPLTVRQIFYRLVGAFAYEKTELAYDRLAECLVRARRACLIPFDDIRDDGVVSYSTRSYTGVDAFWDETGERIRNYRRDRQAGQPVRLELWCEAAGMAPQLARVADDYSVPVLSSGGFASLTAVWLIAERALARNVPTGLLHAGDLDPSGESIFASVTADAAAFMEADRLSLALHLDAVRVALTSEQVAEHDLPTAPPKRTDSRAASWEGGTCQLEAPPPDLLATIVRKAIEAELDPYALTTQIEQEHRNKAELRHQLPR